MFNSLAEAMFAGEKDGAFWEKAPCNEHTEHAPTKALAVGEGEIYASHLSTVRLKRISDVENKFRVMKDLVSRFTLT